MVSQSMSRILGKANPLLKVLTARIEKEERSERAEIVRRLLDRAVQDWKLAKALKMIAEGRWTIRRASGFTGLTYKEILEKITEQRLDSGPSLKDLREALDRS